MPKMKPATPEELQQIKEHFESCGYGIISDETAKAQTYILKLIRQGMYEETMKQHKGK